MQEQFGNLKNDILVDRVEDAFEDAQVKAAPVSDRIDSVEDVTDDLFDDWEEELELISNASLRSRSADK